MTAKGIRYAHTNLIAHDWQKLARFYQNVFACTPVPPARDQSGAWLTKATGVPDAHLRGMHLRLPGHGDQGPTLEIYTYTSVGTLRFTYARDPEGNLLELQHWGA